MFGFSILTIKSLNLSRLFRSRGSGKGGYFTAKKAKKGMQVYESLDQGSSGLGED